MAVGRKKAIRKAIKPYLKERKKGEAIQHTLAETIQAIENYTGPPIPEAHAKYLMPGTWGFDKTGLTWAKVGAQGVETKTVCPAIAYLSRRTRDVSTGEMSVELQWFERGKWRPLLSPRDVVFDSRKFVKLAAQGFPVSSEIAGLTSKYLFEFEGANIGVLPTDSVSSQQGWTEDSKTFLLGASVYGEQGTTFQGADAGDAQIARAFTTAGDHEIWKKTVAELIHFVRVRIGLYVVAAAPLMKILGVPGFVFDVFAPSSKGKTIWLRFIMSFWGCPDERSADSIVHSWDATTVARERICPRFR